jgi:hypothetical protein
MKRRLLAMAPVFVACAIVVLVQSGFAQGQKIDKNAEEPGPIVIELVLSRAIVDAIDDGKRTVTLKLPDGAAQTLKTGPEVKNVDQGKVGNLDHTTFIESIAVFVRTSNAPTSKAENAVDRSSFAYREGGYNRPRPSDGHTQEPSRKLENLSVAAMWRTSS